MVDLQFGWSFLQFRSKSKQILQLGGWQLIKLNTVSAASSAAPTVSINTPPLEIQCVPEKIYEKRSRLQLLKYSAPKSAAQKPPANANWGWRAINRICSIANEGNNSDEGEDGRTINDSHLSSNRTAIQANHDVKEAASSSAPSELRDTGPLVIKSPADLDSCPAEAEARIAKEYDNQKVPRAMTKSQGSTTSAATTGNAGSGVHDQVTAINNSREEEEEAKVINHRTEFTGGMEDNDGVPIADPHPLSRNRDPEVVSDCSEGDLDPAFFDFASDAYLSCDDDGDGDPAKVLSV